MTKEKMLRALPMHKTAIYNEYRVQGYADPIEKTIKWYMENYTKAEIKDMYDEIMA